MENSGFRTLKRILIIIIRLYLYKRYNKANVFSHKMKK